MKVLSKSYKHILVHVFAVITLFALFSFMSSSVHADPAAESNPGLQVELGDGGIGLTKIPTLGDILTFAIRGFFVIAGLAAHFYMLLGAFAWVTSGGDKDAVSAAQQKIQAAVVGVIIIVAVLAIIWTLETVVFGSKICFGLACPVTIPSLVN